MSEGSVAQLARRVAGEHDKVRRLLALVEAALGRDGPRAGSGPDVVAVRLDTLRGPLRAHFDEEEREGFLHRIQQRGQREALLCALLRDQHRALIEDLDSLRAVPALDRRRPPWLRDVRRFLEDLAGHERQESGLLDEARGEP